MRKKIIFLLFALCLFKLYDIAGRSLNFSPNLFVNSFKKNAGEQSSLNHMSNKVVPLRNFLLSKNILEYKLSEEMMRNNFPLTQRVVEFIYPIKINKNSPILITHHTENAQENCELLYFSESVNVYECK